MFFCSESQNSLFTVVVVVVVLVRGGTSCRAGRANAPPDFDARGENRSLPSHISMASLPEVRLKFSEN